VYNDYVHTIHSVCALFLLWQALTDFNNQLSVTFRDELDRKEE